MIEREYRTVSKCLSNGVSLSKSGKSNYGIPNLKLSVLDNTFIDRQILEDYKLDIEFMINAWFLELYSTKMVNEENVRIFEKRIKKLLELTKHGKSNRN